MSTVGREHGYSLVEALVAAGIVALLLTPVLGLFTTARWALDQAAGMSVAGAVARAELEQQAELANDDLDRVVPRAEAPVPGFDRYRSSLETEDLASYGGRVVLRRVTVTVRWTGNLGRTFTYGLTTDLRRRD